MESTLSSGTSAVQRKEKEEEEEDRREEIEITVGDEDEEDIISCRLSIDIDISIDSLNYSDADDQSWHSPYHSNAGTYDDYDYDYSEHDSDVDAETSSKQGARIFIADAGDSELDLEKGFDKPKPKPQPQPQSQGVGSSSSVAASNAAEHDQQNNAGAQLMRCVSKTEKECRICHLGLETTHEAGASMVLGCSCKDDLAAAHKQCAEAWFKIRGNRTCEICGSTARNVVGIEDSEFMDQWNEGNVAPPIVTETRSFWRGHRFLNFLLACMVFAFVISWLFHFNIPS